MSSKLKVDIGWSQLAVMFNSFFGKVTMALSLFLVVAPVLDLLIGFGFSDVIKGFMAKLCGSIVFVTAHLVFLLRSPSEVREFSTKPMFVAVSDDNLSEQDMKDHFNRCIEAGYLTEYRYENAPRKHIAAKYWDVIELANSGSRNFVVCSTFLALALFYAKDIWTIGSLLFRFAGSL